MSAFARHAAPTLSIPAPATLPPIRHRPIDRLTLGLGCSYVSSVPKPCRGTGVVPEHNLADGFRPLSPESADSKTREPKHRRFLGHPTHLAGYSRHFDRGHSS